jgi:ribosomal protein L11 methyltransferase
MEWIEISLHATAEAVDWVKTQLAEGSCENSTGTACIQNLQMMPHQSISQEEQSQPNWGYTVRFYLSGSTSTTAIEEITERLFPLSRTGLISEPEIARVSREADFGLKAPVLIHPIGERFVVVHGAEAEAHDHEQPDEPKRDRDREIVIRLENTLAFGSGLHPATQLSLQVLERYVQPGMRVLDLGCGSGILSVAMAKLGAQVLALDNDAISIQATHRAIALNHVEHQVDAQIGSLGQGSTLGHWMGEALPDAIRSTPAAAQFDLIAANILARIHIALATDYRQALRPNGLLISAGFTVDYAVDINAAFEAVGLVQVGSDLDGEWMTLVHRLIDR